MPHYNAATEDGLEAWRDSLGDLLDVLADGSIERLDALRSRYTEMLKRHPVPSGVVVNDLVMGSIRAKRVTPENRVPGRTLLYFHGGAYLFGAPEGYVALGGRLALAMKAEVLIPDFRLAPEHPYPVPILDCVDAYAWLLEQGQDPAAVIFSGDSAGGSLTVSVMMHARERGMPLPAAGFAISPWADLAHTGESMSTREGIDPLCTRSALDLQARAFLGGARVTVPDASPVHADLRGLPPILIQIGEAEVMLSGAISLATRLGEHGVHVALEIVPDMFHVWHLFAAVLPEAEAAIHRASKFVSAVIPAP